MNKETIGEESIPWDTDDSKLGYKQENDIAEDERVFKHEHSFEHEPYGTAKPYRVVVRGDLKSAPSKTGKE